MLVFLNILVFIVVFGLVVFVHELGHFFVAKKTKILAYEFALGMGPKIVSAKKGETTYSLRLVPIGGFVSMAGEDLTKSIVMPGMKISIKLDEDENVTNIFIDNEQDGLISGRVTAVDLLGVNNKPLFISLSINDEIKTYHVLRNANYNFPKKTQQIAPHERNFSAKPIWARALTLFAGAFMNFVFAFLILLILGGIAGRPSNETIIGSINDRFPASHYLQVGDEIISINNNQVSTWQDIGTNIRLASGNAINILFNRNNQEQTVTIYPFVDIRSVGLANFNRHCEVMSGTKIGQAIGNAASHFNEGDFIVSILVENNFIAVNSWPEMVVILNDLDVEYITFEVGDVDGVIREITYKAWLDATLNSQNIAKISISIGISPNTYFDFGYMFVHAFRSFGNFASIIFRTLGMLFTPSQIGVGDLAGPIGIFTVIGQLLGGGVIAILSFTAMLSINLGIVNLLPIPALDGGRLVFLLIEAITRKKVNPKLENTINNIMFILLMLLFVFVAFNDILRLFR